MFSKGRGKKYFCKYSNTQPCVDKTSTEGKQQPPSHPPLAWAKSIVRSACRRQPNLIEKAHSPENMCSDSGAHRAWAESLSHAVWFLMPPCQLPCSCLCGPPRVRHDHSQKVRCLSGQVLKLETNKTDKTTQLGRMQVRNQRKKGEAITVFEVWPFSGHMQ